MKVTSLTPDDVKPRGRPKGALAKIRAHHHLVAKLFALGMKPTQIAPLVRRTPATVRNWLDSPASQELVAQYAEAEHTKVVKHEEYVQELMLEARALAAEQMVDALRQNETDGLLGFEKLLKAFEVTADRTGMARQTLSVTLHGDLGDRIDQAKARSKKVIEARVEGNVVKFDRRF